MESPSVPEEPAKKPGRYRRVMMLAGGAIAALAALGILRAGDVIDLPAWANVPGVDLPLVGDKDAIDCRLAIADDTSDPIQIQIDIVDGDQDSYPDYEYVWNNGNLVDNTVYERLSDSRLIVPIQDDKPEQFFSVSIEPVREGRVFCESITVG